MTFRLRVGTAVLPVDEGLLLCGRSTELLRCGRSMQTVWRALEPALATGLDPDELTDLQPGTAAAVQRLLTHLDTAGLLVEATPATPGRLGVAGTGGWTEDLVASLGAAGLDAGPDTGASGLPGPGAGGAAVQTVRWEVSSGEVPGRGPEQHLLRVGWVGSATGDGLLLVADQQQWDAACAGEALRPASRDRPDILDLRVAGTLVAEMVRRSCEVRVGHHPGPSWHTATSTFVRAGGSTSVTLSPQPRIVPGAVPATVAVEPDPPRRDDAALLTAIERLTAMPFGPWRPHCADNVAQRPLALHSIQAWTGGPYCTGAAATLQAARADAVLAVLRRNVAATASPPITAPDMAAAGHGELDFLADGIGRLLVQHSPGHTELHAAHPPAHSWTRHWWGLLQRRFGRAPWLGRTGSELAPRVVLVVAAEERGASLTSWGYGADLPTAAEHALRGLLRQTTASDRSETAVPVCHLPDSAPALLEAIAPGLGTAPAEQRATLLSSQLQRLTVTPVSIAGAAGSGLRAGRVGVG